MFQVSFFEQGKVKLKFSIIRKIGWLERSMCIFWKGQYGDFFCLFKGLKLINLEYYLKNVFVTS